MSKKSIVESLNRNEKHSLAGRKINGSEKILEQSAVERDWYAEKPLLFLEFNKPNKRNVCDIN